LFRLAADFTGKDRSGGALQDGQAAFDERLDQEDFARVALTEFANQAPA